MHRFFLSIFKQFIALGNILLPSQVQWKNVALLPNKRCTSQEGQIHVWPLACLLFCIFIKILLLKANTRGAQNAADKETPTLHSKGCSSSLAKGTENYSTKRTFRNGERASSFKAIQARYQNNCAPLGERLLRPADATQCEADSFVLTHQFLHPAQQ